MHPRVRVLQTLALLLGYQAETYNNVAQFLIKIKCVYKPVEKLL